MEIIHHHFESLVSTNDWAKQQIGSFDRDKMTLVTADKQTGGKGQYNRDWFSPSKEGLYVTFCFFIDEKIEESAFLTQVMALALVQLLEKREISALIKWPNDILVSRKKIAGILCETIPLSPHKAIILGVGLNINTSQKNLARISHQHSSRFGQTVLPDDKERPEGRVKLTLPKGYLKSDGETDGQNSRTVGEKCGLETIKKPATSCLAETGKVWDISKELHLLQEIFCGKLELFLQKGFAPFQSTLRARTKITYPIRTRLE